MRIFQSTQLAATYCALHGALLGGGARFARLHDAARQILHAALFHARKVSDQLSGHTSPDTRSAARRSRPDLRSKAQAPGLARLIGDMSGSSVEPLSAQPVTLKLAPSS